MGIRHAPPLQALAAWAGAAQSQEAVARRAAQARAGAVEEAQRPAVAPPAPWETCEAEEAAYVLDYSAFYRGSSLMAAGGGA